MFSPQSLNNVNTILSWKAAQRQAGGGWLGGCTGGPHLLGADPAGPAQGLGRTGGCAGSHRQRREKERETQTETPPGERAF